jgi:hypothetical protein
MFFTSTTHAAGYSHKRAIQMVRNAYCRVLERPVDQSGLVTYAAKLERGKMTVKDLIRALAKSAEHQKRFFEDNTPKRFSYILIDHILAPGRSILTDPPVDEVVMDKLIHQGVHGAIDYLIEHRWYTTHWGKDIVPGKGRRPG